MKTDDHSFTVRHGAAWTYVDDCVLADGWCAEHGFGAPGCHGKQPK